MLPPPDLEKALETVATGPKELVLHRLCSLEAWEGSDPKRLLYDEGPKQAGKAGDFLRPRRTVIADFIAEWTGLLREASSQEAGTGGIRASASTMSASVSP